MKLTKNFFISEFACKDGSEVPMDLIENVKILAEQLQVLRDFFDLPITINSSYRTKNHNKKVGGAKNSQHLLGKAADIVVLSISAKETQKAIELLISNGKMKEGGLGSYNSFTHYDIRNSKARW